MVQLRSINVHSVCEPESEPEPIIDTEIICNARAIFN